MVPSSAGQPSQPSFQDVTDLSDTQIRVAVILPCLMAIFSVIGNVLILYAIITRKMYSGVYGRLMIGFTLSSLMVSLIIMIGPLPVVEQVFGEYGAVGNTASCSTAGFFLQIAFTSNMLYLASLMSHFVMSIRYGYSEEFIKKKLELVSHTVSIIISLFTGALGLELQSFNPSGVVPNMFFLSPYPRGCEITKLIPCQRGEKAPTLMMAFITIPVLCCYLFLNICLFLVFNAVWKRAQASSLRIMSTFKHFKTVEQQSSLYAISFFFTYGLVVILPLARTIIENPLKHQKTLYILQMTVQLSRTLQGVFNWIIFTLPRYKQISHGLEEDQSFWCTLMQVVFWKEDSHQIVLASASFRRQLVRERPVC
jgi:hypothetical protein